jgi:hypothetical protein
LTFWLAFCFFRIVSGTAMSFWVGTLENCQRLHRRAAIRDTHEERAILLVVSRRSVSRLEEKSWPVFEIKFSVAAKIHVHASPKWYHTSPTNQHLSRELLDIFQNSNFATARVCRFSPLPLHKQWHEVAVE